MLRSIDWLVSVREHVPHFLQWGRDPKSTNPHNSGSEVDIDFVLTAFFLVRRVLKCDIVKAIVVAPPHATALPLIVKPPYLSSLSITFGQNLPIDSTPEYYLWA